MSKEVMKLNFQEMDIRDVKAITAISGYSALGITTGVLAGVGAAKVFSKACMFVKVAGVTSAIGLGAIPYITIAALELDEYYHQKTGVWLSDKVSGFDKEASTDEFDDDFVDDSGEEEKDAHAEDPSVIPFEAQPSNSEEQITTTTGNESVKTDNFNHSSAGSEETI